MHEIYDSDRAAAPDNDFEPGHLRHLVPGNRGRLLDPRRTPVTVVGVDLPHGMFDVEVGAFEDAGARWRVALEEVARFQFGVGQELVSDALWARYEQAVERFDKRLRIEADGEAAALTGERLEQERIICARQLDRLGVPARLDPAPFVRRRQGDASVAGAVRTLLEERDLVSLDERFVAQYVSNPWSGEVVKGHAIVAAELGLVSYHGKVVRDPSLFEGDWAKDRRAEHLLVRLAVTAEVWRRAGAPEVVLYRAVSSETALRPSPGASFVSATFSSDVAASHFAGGPATRSAAMYRHRVPIERLLMTFWETAAMNEPFAEAEAILIATNDGPF